MRLTSRLGTGLSGFTLLLAAGTPLATSADGAPRLQPPRSPLAAVRPARVGVPHGRRTFATPSCFGAATGAFAFDSTTTFTTSKVTRFGYGSVAVGNYSATLDGHDNSVCDEYSTIAGGDSNLIDSGNGADGTAAAYSFVGAGTGNVVSGEYSFIGAGTLGSATAPGAFIGAGGTDGVNNIASGQDSFIGAGDGNYTTQLGTFVGGGRQNSADGEFAFVGAGKSNKVDGSNAFIGSGEDNTVSATEAFEGGGSGNTISSTAEYGTLGGGALNDVAGFYATIPGGASNTAAGKLSFAAGYRADATQAGSFVWSDYVSGSSVVKDTAPDQFVVRASGGTYIYSSENLSSGVQLVAGSGAWASLSDRNAKTDIAPLDAAAILAKVAMLPISTWRYKTEAGARHVGPMAQDFYAAFGVGEDDRHITSIDEDGVALAAIKALHAENEGLHAENAALRARLAHSDARLTALERRMDRFEQQ